MREMQSFLWEVVAPFAGMASVEFTDVVIATLGKAAMSKGMSPFIYVFYFAALSTLLLLPPYLFYRPKHQPLTFGLVCAFFLLGLIGLGFAQTLWFIAIRYSSPTLSSAMSSSIPALTFILAIILRMEKLDLRLQSSQVKSVGAIVSISGAFIVTLYKGTPIILILSSSSPSLDTHDHHSILLHLSDSEQSNWVLGGVLLGCCCFLATIWYILQAATVKKYPSEITLVFFYCFFGAIQCGIITYFAEPDPNAWKIKSDLELITIIFAAVFGGVYRTGVQTWGLRKKGPVYVTMFRPLGIVFAVVLGVTFLGDTLYIGSVVGSVVIAVGFYGVMWGKAQEEKMNMVEENGVTGNLQESSSRHGQKVPLLQGNNEMLI